MKQAIWGDKHLSKFRGTHRPIEYPPPSGNPNFLWDQSPDLEGEDGHKAGAVHIYKAWDMPAYEASLKAMDKVSDGQTWKSPTQMASHICRRHSFEDRSPSPQFH